MKANNPGEPPITGYLNNVFSFALKTPIGLDYAPRGAQPAVMFFDPAGGNKAYTG